MVGPDETLVDGKVCKVLKGDRAKRPGDDTAADPLRSGQSGELVQKARVFVTSSASWEMRGSKDSFAGGARPQTAEVIKTFSERCPQVTVTMKSELADYAVLLDHEGGKDLARRKNKIAVFNRAGDLVFSQSTRSLGNSVKDACGAIANIPLRARRPSPATPATPIPEGTQSAGAAARVPISWPGEIRFGTTIADVEKILGVPATRVDLGEKVLYKYKDMTVEFHDGKVTDVR
jgi:hypothetical protein